MTFYLFFRCDADPAALAKYIIALVKKDKSPEALQQSMVSQLDVFLQSGEFFCYNFSYISKKSLKYFILETESFVKLLFNTLEKQDYIQPVIPNANPPNPNIIKAEVTSPKNKLEPKPIIPINEIPSLTESVNGSSLKKDKEHEPKRDLRKSESEKEEKPLKRSRLRSTSRNRSRSRSWDRSRRSRSRDKSRDRDQHRLDRDKRGRPWRNKSPPRRYERRRSRSVSPGRLRSRSRSPRHGYRGRYRNRSPPRSASRSRSRSTDRKERKDSKSEKEIKEFKDQNSGAGTPTQDSNHGDMDLRLTNSTQSIQSVVVQQNNSENRQGKRRCRDYDEKGYCMRGEMCPFDHGIDPVVLEDTALTRVLSYAPNGAPVSDVPPILAPPIIPTPGHPMMHPMNPRPLPQEYNPQAPQIWNRPGFRGPRPLIGPRVSLKIFLLLVLNFKNQLIMLLKNNFRSHFLVKFCITFPL